MNAARSARLVDGAVLAAILAYSIGVWWPTRALPYHWDAAMFTIPAARDLLATHFRPFVVGHSDFAHPPVFMALLALAWEAFGMSRAVSHALVFPFLPLAMGGTYMLGARLPDLQKAHGDRALGAAAAFLFGGVAVVLEEVGQIYAELPAAAAVSWGLVALFRRRVWTAALLFALAASFRIPTLIVPAALGLFVLATPAGRRRPLRWVPLLVPFALVTAWLVYHRAVTGWSLSLPDRESHAAHDPIAFVQGFGAVVAQLLLSQWRFLVPVLGVAAAVLARRARGRWDVPAAAVALLVCVACGCAFFAVFGEFGLRYGVFLLPPYFVGALALGRTAPLPRGLFAVVVAVVFGLFVTTWRPTLPPTTGYDFTPPQDLAYLDIIAIGRDAARYVEERYPSAEIYGAVPESYELTDPDDGYVAAPRAFSECARFERHTDRRQLIYRHPYSPGQVACARLVESVGGRLKQRFSSNGKWLEIFLVPKLAAPVPDAAP